MTAQDLLTQLRHRGATVRAVNGRVRVEGPPVVITADVRSEVKRQKNEILGLLMESSDPTQYAPDPIPPEQPGARVVMDEDTAVVFAHFAEHGTQPAWDDLIGATKLERQLRWCQTTLEDVYRGRLTLSLGGDGGVHVFERGQPS